MKENKMYLKLIPVMVVFFTMGFVDLVGIATNYVKRDFQLTDTIANLLPSMVFIWFLLCSIPTGLLMNRIGRRKTVIISVFVTFLSLIIPLLGYSYLTMMISFALLGIGNAIMQVSLNPLVSNIVSGDKLASSLTFGQFCKAIASFLGPIIAAWALTATGNWRMLYPIFAAIAIVAVIWLIFTPIEEEEIKTKTSGFKQCFSLLGDGLTFMLFLGILCHVGLDVGYNMTAPKILMERSGMALQEAGYVTSIYFLFRTIGSFSGTFILAHFSPKKFFTISVLCMIVATVALFAVQSTTMIYVCFALIGFGNSNIFSVVFSKAMNHEPEHKNEVSGLMIMGLFGGSIFSILAGLASDGIGSQIGALIVFCLGLAYLLYLSTQLNKQ